MKKLNIPILMGLCVLLVPVAALAGNGDTGACYVVEGLPAFPQSLDPEGKFALAGCADGLTQAECDSVDELTLWAEGATCADLALKGGFDWEGSCAADIPPLGNLCILLWTDIGGSFTEGLCENDIGGTWFDDPTCGAPVPTMPGFGMAAMVLLMMSGALILLTLRGSLPKA